MQWLGKWKKSGRKFPTAEEHEKEHQEIESRLDEHDEQLEEHDVEINEINRRLRKERLLYRRS